MRKSTPVKAAATDNFDTISIIIAAHNEASCIGNTLQSLAIQLSKFPQLSIFVGLDACTDQTEAIVRSFSENYKNRVQIFQFDRIGKGQIVNRIIENQGLNLKKGALILMDANIQLEENCIEKLIEVLQYPTIGIVGAQVLPMTSQGNTEENYILVENRKKYLEGQLFGTTMGVFGACFAMRGDVFRPIPENFITDDLFLSFSTIRSKYQVLTSDKAIVYETITADVVNEFYRKKRYGAGNFQIVFHFLDLLNPFRSSLGFVYCYTFHKLLRWTLPIFIFLFWLISFFYLNYSPVFFVLNGIGDIVILFVWINYLRLKGGKKLIFQSFFYFLAMNIAILVGFFNYIKGIQTNVWTRSSRN